VIELSQSVDGILERAEQSMLVMNRVAESGGWVWPGLDPVVFADAFTEAGQREDDVRRAVAVERRATGEWDWKQNEVVEDMTLGLRLARLRFKGQPAKAALFAGLKLNNTGRESRQQQALDFELSWKKADAAWVFKEELTLAVFRAHRLALRDLEEAHGGAAKDETYARGLLRESLLWLHEKSVDWYEAATATFAEQTATGAFIRTIPTTYDPNRPPGPLVFTRAESPAAGAAALRWRSPRGEKFTLWALAPGAKEWVKLLDGVKENSWSGEKLEPGTWRFKGGAVNPFGEGTESEVISVPVAAAEAA
jgi:hypothetical protein